MIKDKINSRFEKFQSLETDEIFKIAVVSKKDNQSLDDFINLIVPEMKKAYRYVDDAEILIVVRRIEKNDK